MNFQLSDDFKPVLRVEDYALLNPNLFPDYENACAKINPLLTQVSVISQEALNNGILGRCLVSITDTFVGILNTLKTNCFKFTKTLKRSEMREFVESNRLKTSVVSRIPYNKVQELQINVPANLSGMYLDAVTSVGTVYVKLNAVSTAKTTLGSFNSIFSSITSGSGDVKKQIASTSTILGGIVAASKPTVLSVQSAFSSKAVGTRPYSQVFRSTKEFAEVTTELLALESRLQDVSELVEIIGKIESSLKGLHDALSKPAGEVNPPLDQNSLFKLGEIAKGLALIFDSYGLATTRQMELEHNHVLNMSLIYDKARD